MKKAESKPYWPIVNDHALLAENLPRVLGAMRLGLHCGTVARGDIKWWQPEYLRGPTMGSIAPTFPARDAAAREAAIASFIAGERAWRAPVNRAMRDADVHLFTIDGKRLTNRGRILAVCSYGGEWRTAAGDNRGRDLIELGQWRWSCRFGQAAYRIAKLLGWSSIPLQAEAA